MTQRSKVLKEKEWNSLQKEKILWYNEGSKERDGFYDEKQLEKEYCSVFNESNLIPVWLFFGSICNHVAYYPGNKIRSDDDRLHYMWIFANLFLIPFCRGVGGPI